MDDFKAHDPSQSAFTPEGPQQSDVDEILRRKRKAREYKVCILVSYRGRFGRSLS